jgi:hypothetical protein
MDKAFDKHIGRIKNVKKTLFVFTHKALDFLVSFLNEKSDILSSSVKKSDAWAKTCSDRHRLDRTFCRTTYMFESFVEQSPCSNFLSNNLRVRHFCRTIFVFEHFCRTISMLELLSHNLHVRKLCRTFLSKNLDVRKPCRTLFFSTARGWNNT